MNTTTPTTSTPESPMIRRSRNQHNANAIRHGMRGSALPPGCGYIAKAILHFRRQLETAVIDVRGEITIFEAATINTAFRHERLAQLAQRWLTESYDTLSHAERLAYARESARASAERDKCIAALNLNESPAADLWNGSLPLLPVPATTAPTSPAAGDGEPHDKQTDQQADAVSHFAASPLAGAAACVPATPVAGDQSQQPGTEGAGNASEN